MKPIGLLFLVALLGCQTPKNQPDTPTSDTKPSKADALSAAQHAVEKSFLLAPPIAPMAPQAIRGIALPMYSEFPALTYEHMVDRAHELGATHISLVVTWDQQTIHHNTIRPTPGLSPDDKRVRAIIDHAHNKNLKVMLFPIVHVVQRNDGEWRGKMAPTNLQRWQLEYRAFILHYANIAAAAGADVFSVGSELSSLEAHEPFWRSLIQDVRATYAGTLVYSANWDHYTHPKFWDDLDLIGVSSYFEVAKHPSEPTFVVSQRWTEERDRLLGFANSFNKPLLLTEVGYPTVTTAAVRPWDYTVKGGPDSLQQLAAFRSLVDAWAQTPVDDFHGAFVWHGWGWGGAADTSYNVFAKPSESAVRAWFSSSPR